jgi:Domain of unknown function (DUF4189)
MASGPPAAARAAADSARSVPEAWAWPYAIPFARGASHDLASLYDNSLVNTMQGSLQCNVLSGTFENTEYKGTGEFQYTFSDDGASFTGSWQGNKGYTGSWSGYRLQTATPTPPDPDALLLLAWLGEECYRIELQPTKGPQLPGHLAQGFSEPCTIYIEDWRRNTAKPVVVEFPEQIDAWGAHDNGVTVFPASNRNFSLQRQDVANMSGFRSGWPEAQPRHPGHEVYAWNLLFSARLDATGSPIPIVVYQEGDDEKGMVQLVVIARVIEAAPEGRGGTAGLAGAIAYDHQSGAWGTAVDYPSQEVADQVAMAECSKHSGECILMVQFVDRCGAYAAGADGGGGWGIADSRAEAESAALESCNNLDRNCSVRVWACSATRVPR